MAGSTLWELKGAETLVVGRFEGQAYDWLRICFSIDSLAKPEDFLLS
jgi:hypothetical protein